MGLYVYTTPPWGGRGGPGNNVPARMRRATLLKKKFIRITSPEVLWLQCFRRTRMTIGDFYVDLDLDYTSTEGAFPMLSLLYGDTYLWR